MGFKGYDMKLWRTVQYISVAMKSTFLLLGVLFIPDSSRGTPSHIGVSKACFSGSVFPLCRTKL